MDLTICSPAFASPRAGVFTVGSNFSLLANRYATIALISTSFRTASSGDLLFVLYQNRGIQVVCFTARGLRIHVLTQSGLSLASIFVRIGPGRLMSGPASNPLVL